jgi:hypothetical protein
MAKARAIAEKKIRLPKWTIIETLFHRAYEARAPRSILWPRQEENSSFLTELRERPRFGLTSAARLTIEPQLSNHGLMDCEPGFAGNGGSMT